MSAVNYCPLLQLFSIIKSEDRIKRRGDFFWSVWDFSFEKDTIGHIFTGQYYGLQPYLIYSVRSPLSFLLLFLCLAAENLKKKNSSVHKIGVRPHYVGVLKFKSDSR